MDLKKCVENYDEEVTDLVVERALELFRRYYYAALFKKEAKDET